MCYHCWTYLLQRKVQAWGIRYTLPHLFLCIFKAFRYKVDILKSCDETLLFAGNLGIKGLYFGMSRKWMLDDKESVNQRIPCNFMDHIANTTTRISTPLNVLVQWPQPAIPNLFPTVLFNPQYTPAKQMARYSPKMPQDHLHHFVPTLFPHKRHLTIFIYAYSCIMTPTS